MTNRDCVFAGGRGSSSVFRVQKRLRHILASARVLYFCGIFSSFKVDHGGVRATQYRGDAPGAGADGTSQTFHKSRNQVGKETLEENNAKQPWNQSQISKGFEPVIVITQVNHRP